MQMKMQKGIQQSSRTGPIIKAAYCILHLTLNAVEWFGVQDDIELRDRAMRELYLAPNVSRKRIDLAIGPYSLIFAE